ncbi:MAG TPA: sulfonate ABC transporter substrate-binding protein, partial [Burkholderiaceae bacterium]|nr:sulfonate ABC transporter substrate-binding protein [Burkholderiaceae bacterium]
WGGANRPALSKELAALWGIPPQIVEVSVGRSQFGTGRITKAILAEQQRIADTFHELKLIPKPISVLNAAPADIT